MITAVSNFKVDNSRGRVANYQKSNNYVSRTSISNQPADSFTKSNQVSFKGSPIALLSGKGKLAKVSEGLLADAGKKVSGIAKRFGEEATEAIGGTVRKLKGKNELPDTKIPVVLPTAKDDWVIQKAGEIYKKLPYGSTERSELGTAINNVKTINGSDNLTHTSQRDLIDAVHGGQDKLGIDHTAFGGGDVDYTGADLVPDTVKETAKEAGSAVAESAAGEAVTVVASEVGTFVATEFLGEGFCQTIERSIDCVLPGVGGLITLARWIRRGYKVGKIIDKL